MRKRFRNALGILLVAIVVGMLWHVLGKASEPTYHGKSVSVWAEAFFQESATGFDTSRGGKEADAIHEIGTNAVPSLLRMARSKDSQLKSYFVYYAQKQSLIPIHYTPSFMRNQQSVGGFVALGVLVEGAIPELARLVNDPYHAEAAAESLAGISPKALRPLLNAITNQNAIVRAAAAGALGEGLTTNWMVCVNRMPGSAAPLGSDASEAIAALIICAKDSDVSVRQRSTSSLGKIRQKPELVVPVLMTNLQDSFPNCRTLAAQSLAWFGKDARMAIPALLKTETDPDANVRFGVMKALIKVDPEYAAKALAK